MGKYGEGKYGVRGTLHLLNRNLTLTACVAHLLNHNGVPYNINHSALEYDARISYYWGNFYASLSYRGPVRYPDGCMTGIWVKSRSSWHILAGWSNDKWSVYTYLVNPTRWHWRSAVQEMRSPLYDSTEIQLSGLHRAFIQLTASYTIDFGKKVKHDNEPEVSGAASSGILH